MSPAMSGSEPRVSRFDRPKPPRDWRWVVGGLGKILISAGLLMFGLVAYQLWGTGLQTAAAQNRLEDEFSELVETASSSTTTTTTTTPGVTTTTVDEPADTSTTVAALPAPPLPERGQPVARLEIPRISVDKIVVVGAKTENLKDGPGHFPESPIPGQLGNSAIAGHRTTYGAPFIDLDQLEVGDQMITTTVFGGRFVYAVTEMLVVGPADYALVVPTLDQTKATLTLVTCTPKYTARDRLVVRGELIAELSDAPFAYPTIPIEPDPDETLPDEPTPSESVPDETVPDTSVPEVAQTEDVVDDSEVFGGGWFSDKGAPPHVALWGLVVTAIALGAYAISRWTRRNWVGALVGIVPFVVALYFWFENVNRLLPPSL